MVAFFNKILAKFEFSARTSNKTCLKFSNVLPHMLETRSKSVSLKYFSITGHVCRNLSFSAFGHT